MKKKLVSLFLLFNSLFSHLWCITCDNSAAQGPFWYKGLPDEEPVEIPFAYKGLSADEREKTTVVHERGYTIIKNPGKEFALLTPLSPCIGVGVKNLLSGVSWWGHWHFSNSGANALQQVEQALNITNVDPKNLAVFIFSKKLAPDEYNNGFRRVHRGKSQNEQMAFVQQTFIQGLRLNENQIQTHLFEKEQDLPDPSVDRSILVDGTDQNGILRAYSTSPYDELKEMKSYALSTSTFDFTKKAYGRLRMSPYILNNIWGYNKVKFTEAPQYNGSTITSIPGTDTNPYNDVSNIFSPFNMAVIATQVGYGIVAGIFAKKIVVKFLPKTGWFKNRMRLS